MGEDFEHRPSPLITTSWGALQLSTEESDCNPQEFWGTQPEAGLARAKWHLAICVLAYKSIFILHSTPQYI